MVVRSSLIGISVCLLCFLLFGFCDAQTASIPHPVSIQEVPFVASLQGSRLPCSASIIHARYLLTAASCLVDDEGGLVNLTKVLVGTNDLSKSGQLYDIQSTIPHNEYFIQTGDYNVGLVKLAEYITFGPNVRPIWLAERSVHVGDLVNVVGWGTIMNPSSTGPLQEVMIPVLHKEACQGGLVGRIIGPRMLCAGVNGKYKGDCVSDVGGPVYINGTLVAVVSPSSGCKDLPGLYTKVSPVRKWIINTIKNDEN